MAARSQLKAIKYSDFFQSDILFTLVGSQFYPATDKKLKRGVNYWSFFLFKVLGIFVVGSFIVSGYLTLNQLLDSLESFGCAIAAFTSLIRIGLIMIYKRSDITKIIKKLQRHFPQSASEQAVYNTKTFLRVVTVMNFWAVVVISSMIIHHSIMPFTLQLNAWLRDEPREWEGIAKICYPFDRMQPLAFWLTYVFEMWILLNVPCLIGFTDMIYGEITTVISMEFRMIAQRIESINPQDEGAIDEMKKLVDTHEELLGIIGEIGEIFSPIMLMNLFTMIVVICCAGFFLTREGSYYLYKYSVVFFTGLYNGFFGCFYGDYMTKSSQAVAAGAYNSQWYNGNVKFKKMILMIMTRAQNGEMYKAYKFVDVNLETYKWMVETAYSYYQVLVTAYEMDVKIKVD